MNSYSKSRCNRREQRGAAAPMVAIVVVILVLMAIGAWFLILRPSSRMAVAPRPVTTTANSAASTRPPPADVASMSAQQLLDEARNAVRAQRWVSPAGNNAFEFYLQVLQKDPGNQVARNALRESFTTGANAAEQSINAGNFDEAEREIGLLAQADSGNYTLTILRSKLDAQRKLDARAEEQQKQQEAAEARKAAAAALAAAAPQPEEKEKPAPTPVQSAEQVAKAPPPAAPEPAPEPKVVKPVGPTRGALLVKSAQAVPPRMAVRRHRSGWVDVVFTVDAQGNVVDAHVSDSQPSHVFDRAAIAAVERYKFKPALKDGVPIATKAKQRINFNL